MVEGQGWNRKMKDSLETSIVVSHVTAKENKIKWGWGGWIARWSKPEKWKKEKINYIGKEFVHIFLNTKYNVSRILYGDLVSFSFCAFLLYDTNADSPDHTVKSHIHQVNITSGRPVSRAYTTTTLQDQKHIILPSLTFQYRHCLPSFS